MVKLFSQIYAKIVWLIEYDPTRLKSKMQKAAEEIVKIKAKEKGYNKKHPKPPLPNKS